MTKVNKVAVALLVFVAVIIFKLTQTGSAPAEPYVAPPVFTMSQSDNGLTAEFVCIREGRRDGYKIQIVDTEGKVVPEAKLWYNVNPYTGKYIADVEWKTVPRVNEEFPAGDVFMLTVLQFSPLLNNPDSAIQYYLGEKPPTTKSKIKYIEGPDMILAAEHTARSECMKK